MANFGKVVARYNVINLNRVFLFSCLFNLLEKNLYEKFYDRKRNHGEFSYGFFERLAPVGLCR